MFRSLGKHVIEECERIVRSGDRRIGMENGVVEFEAENGWRSSNERVENGCGIGEMRGREAY